MSEKIKFDRFKSFERLFKQASVFLRRGNRRAMFLPIPINADVNHPPDNIQIVVDNDEFGNASKYNNNDVSSVCLTGNNLFFNFFSTSTGTRTSVISKPFNGCYGQNDTRRYNTGYELRFLFEGQHALLSNLQLLKSKLVKEHKILKH